MSGSGGSATSDGGGSLRTRQILLVALAILALIVAAFAIPPIDAASGPNGDGEGDGPANPQEQPADPTPTPTPVTPTDGSNDRSDGQAGGGGQDGPEDRVRVEGNRSGDGGDGPRLTPSGTRPHPDCFVVVWDRLVPGKNVTVFRWYDGSYVENRTVWFEDRRIGQTDRNGRLDGRVPYVRELQLTAAVGDVESCHLLALGMETDYDEWQGKHGSPQIVVDTSQLRQLEPARGNVSVALPVHGNATVAVQGEPYPGETVRVNATVDGIPMRQASVTVNGQQVGETDSRGFADLRVPDDGTERLRIAVARGDFRATTTIDVLLLTVDVTPESILAVPGGDATVNATLADRPARNVTVAIDGTTVAQTDDRGLATITLPADPGATIRVTGAGQTATAPVWPLYVPTALLLVLGIGLVAGSIGYARRSGTAGSARPVLAVWAGLAVVVVAGLRWGTRGVLAVLGVGVLVAVLLATVVYRGTVGRWVRAIGRWLVGVVRAIEHLAIGLADWLGWLADRGLGVVRALVARLSGLPRSVRGLLAVLGGWMAGLPGRAGRLVRWALAWLGDRVGVVVATVRTPRGVAALVVAIGLIAAGYVAFDEAGGIAVFGALCLLWGVWRLLHRATGRDGRSVAEPSTTDGTTSSTGAGTTGGERSPVSLYTLWRTFARWVVPGRWQRRTPGEIARAAVDRGFPAEPVAGLTEAFREVEYGQRPESENRLDRAQTAFEALRTSRQDEERGEQ